MSDEVARLRAALAWYADERNWRRTLQRTRPDRWTPDITSAAEQDAGQRARAALAQARQAPSPLAVCAATDEPENRRKGRTMETTTTGTTWGLIAGRHPMPVTGYIIEGEVSADPRDAAALAKAVAEGMDRFASEPGPHTILVTGLTTAAMYAVAAVLNDYFLPYPEGVIFAAYDRESERYLPVLTVVPREDQDGALVPWPVYPAADCETAREGDEQG